jgi:hypothetical protein
MLPQIRLIPGSPTIGADHLSIELLSVKLRADVQATEAVPHDNCCVSRASSNARFVLICSVRSSDRLPPPVIERHRNSVLEGEKIESSA